MKLYPEIVLACANNDDTAPLIEGVKFYFITKHYDRVGGSGLVYEKEFMQYTERYLGISRATYYKWKKRAKILNLFKQHKGIIQLVNWGKAALSCGCERVTFAVDVGLTQFVDDQGLSEVYAGWIKKIEPKKKTDKAPAQKQRPITKSTIRKLTGIPESTQRYYEAKAGVKKTANIAHVASVYQGAENAPSGQGGGYYAKNGCHRQRLGNTYHAPDHIKRLKRGRIKKINHTIRVTLSQKPGSDQPEKVAKLYFHPAYKPLPREAVENELKRRAKAATAGKPINTPLRLYSKLKPSALIKSYLKRLSVLPAQKRPNRVYAYDRTCLGVGLWAAFDTETGVTA